MIQSLNPATGEVIKTFSPHSNGEIESRLQQAQKAFLAWSALTFSQRAKYYNQLAKDLKNNSKIYAQTIIAEMGKPLTQAIAEVEKCAWAVEYFAQNPEFFAELPIQTEFQKSYIRHDPLGVVLGIMPWNFPFWQVFRAAAPIIIGGNVLVVKHASNVPQSALLIEKIFRKNKFPEGVYTALLVEGAQTASIIKHDAIKAVTLTGSEEAGKHVAKIAGESLKKTVLELGGSDAFIVLEDADVEKAAQTAVLSRVINSGQSCISAKRFIVVKKKADQFLKIFKKKCLN